MNILAAHIEYLLTLHDCVIVPDFGGFVLRYQSAMFASDGRMIPPRKVVGFNPILKYNDGLLANSIMREQSISFQEAMNRINSEVRSFQSILQNDQWTELGGIGAFKYTVDGLIDFMPSETNSFDLNLFGFTELQLIPLETKEAPDSVQTECVLPQSSNCDVVMVPVNVRILRHTAAIAAMIIGLLFVSHPLEEKNILSNYASFVSSGFIQNTLYPQISQKDMRDATDYCIDSSLWMSQDFSLSYMNNDQSEYDSSQDYVEIVSDMDGEPYIEDAELSDSEPKMMDSEVAISEVPSSSTLIQPVASQEIATETSVDESAANLTEKRKPQKRYYIILGSFGTESQAQMHISYLSKKGLSGTKILHRGDKYRVYSCSFADKAEGNRHLESLRLTNKDCADAWLMPMLNE